MTVERSEAPSPQEPQPDPAAERSREVLARYRRAMRRRRSVYFGAIAAVVAAVCVVVAIAWSRGEIAHTTLRTASSAPPSVALGHPATSLTRAWHSADRTAIGTPYWGGTVVTHSADSVRGRDARTGAITWSYTRTNRSVCEAIQVQGITLAIFELHGNCDQVTALDTDTGRRQWTRTLDEDGHPVDGRPAYSIGEFTVLISTPSVVYAVDPASGIDRWLFAQGCRINGAVLGSQGALISQTCAHPDCGDRKFCGSGPQLLLRDATAGRNDDDKNRNPDQIKWNRIGSSARPVSADAVVSAVNTAGAALTVYHADDGKPLGQLRVSAGPGSAAAIETDGAELIWLDGSCYALAPGSARPLWRATTSAPPTVTSPEADSTPMLGSARVAVPGRAGIDQLDGVSGAIQRTYPVPDGQEPPRGARAFAFGTGFLVAGPSTTLYR